MWAHPATQANIAALRARGVLVAGPADGPMAEPESGPGRLVEPADLLATIRAALVAGPLTGRHLLVTSGPTHEPIDPVRYIANRASGRQGHAIAGALAALGARVTLVSGPVAQPDPPGVTVVRVESAREMLAACEAALPADGAVCNAAVADWRTARAADQKMKKVPGAVPPPLELALNPDILATLAAAGPRAARVWWSASPPRRRRWSRTPSPSACERAATGSWRTTCPGDVMGGAENTVHLVTETGVEDWPRMAKEDVARRLAARIAEALA